MPRRRVPPTSSPRAIPIEAPPFFVPHAKDAAEAESVWLATFDFAKANGLNPRAERYYCFAYTHEGRECVDVIGEPSSATGEIVLVLLRTEKPGASLVCTPSRGVLRGLPIFAPGDCADVPFSGGEVGT